MTAIPLPYTDACEHIPPDEPADTEVALALTRQILRETHRRTREFRRMVHAKSNGWAVGTWAVLPHLPPELAQGLFAVEATYDVLTRFSNGANAPQSDLVPDARGLAIKVFSRDAARAEVVAGLQDFIFNNQPTFFAADVKDFVRWERVLASDGGLDTLRSAGDAFTAGSWNPFDWRWRDAAAVARLTVQPPQHPGRITYFSQSPFRYGNYVAKFRVQPTGEVSTTTLAAVETFASDPNALRSLLQESLRREPLHFEFQVQLRTSASSMPIEDATVEWPESESPYRSVALLTLPPQEVGASVSREVTEQTAFNIWNTLPAHRPLGGINRLRRAAYAISAEWRRGATHE